MTPETVPLDLDAYFRQADTNPMRYWAVCKICGSMVDVSLRVEHLRVLHVHG